MKKYKKYLLPISSIYWISYFIRSYVIWEFKNPFQWIIDIPKEDNTYRAGVLVFCIVFIVFYTWVFTVIKEELKQKK